MAERDIITTIFLDVAVTFLLSFFLSFFLSFLDLMTTVLNPLAQLFTTGDPQLQADILLCLKDLTRRYAAFDWASFYNPEAARFVCCHSLSPLLVLPINLFVHPARFVWLAGNPAQCSSAL